MKPNKSGWISPFHKCRWLDLKNTKSCFWRNPAMNMIKKKAFGKKNEKLWVFTYIGLLIQNFINFIIISNIISVSFSGWKNMSLAKLVWGVMGAIGQARDGNWFITIAFCWTFNISICFGRKLGFVCLDLSGVVGDNHLWEEISTIGSRCSHGRPTPSSTPDRTHLSDFLFCNLQTKDDEDEDESAYLNSAAEEN